MPKFCRDRNGYYHQRPRRSNMQRVGDATLEFLTGRHRDHDQHAQVRYGSHSSSSDSLAATSTGSGYSKDKSHRKDLYDHRRRDDRAGPRRRNARNQGDRGHHNPSFSPPGRNVIMQAVIPRPPPPAPMPVAPPQYATPPQLLPNADATQSNAINALVQAIDRRPAVVNIQHHYHHDHNGGQIMPFLPPPQQLGFHAIGYQNDEIPRPGPPVPRYACVPAMMLLPGYIQAMYGGHN